MVNDRAGVVLERLRVEFDEERLVANAGLVLTATLSARPVWQWYWPLKWTNSLARMERMKLMRSIVGDAIIRPNNVFGR